MNKSLIFARYQILGSIRSMGVYYLVFVTATVLVNIMAMSTEGSSGSGMEFAAAVFLFVCGLCAFRENFYFAQANNITRKTFFRGLVLSVPPLCAVMVVVDLLLNRLLNLMMPNLMMYDMLYSGLGKPQLYDEQSLSDYIGQLERIWYPSNDIGYVLTGMLWSFLLYCAAFLFGLMITLIYYRANTLQKVIISLVPVALFYVVMSVPMFPGSVLEKILLGMAGFFAQAFGASALLCCLSFAVLGLLFAGIAFLLCRRAVLKKS